MGKRRDDSLVPLDRGRFRFGRKQQFYTNQFLLKSDVYVPHHLEMRGNESVSISAHRRSAEMLWNTMISGRVDQDHEHDL